MTSTPSPSPRALGVRQKHYRNRKVAYRIGDVVTDGGGNIIDRPMTERLACFADPIERLWGRFDEMRQWGDKDPAPYGCAGCPVALHCSQVTEERLNSCPDLLHKYTEWELATMHIAARDRHQHPTWEPFVTHCEAQRWGDANVSKLEEDDRAKKAVRAAKAEREAAAKRRVREAKKKRPRSVPPKVRGRIDAYRDARREELLAWHTKPDAPLWLRNRSPERVTLIPDVWWAAELLSAAGKKASARAIAEFLQAHGRLDADLPAGIRTRINEALARAMDLMSEGWPPFDRYGYDRRELSKRDMDRFRVLDCAPDDEFAPLPPLSVAELEEIAGLEIEDF